MNECKGCKHEKSTDIGVHLEYCTHCKRAYSNDEDREMHEDLYSKTDTWKQQTMSRFERVE